MADPILFHPVQDLARGRGGQHRRARTRDEGGDQPGEPADVEEGQHLQAAGGRRDALRLDHPGEDGGERRVGQDHSLRRTRAPGGVRDADGRLVGPRCRGPVRRRDGAPPASHLRPFECQRGAGVELREHPRAQVARRRSDEQQGRLGRSQCPDELSWSQSPVESHQDRTRLRARDRDLGEADRVRLQEGDAIAGGDAMGGEAGREAIRRVRERPPAQRSLRIAHGERLRALHRVPFEVIEVVSHR